MSLAVKKKSMKILILDEEFPYPLNTGKRIRSFNILSRLAKKAEVHYLAYGDEASESFAELKRFSMNPRTVDRQIQRKSGMIFYWKLLLNLFSKNPYIVSSHYSFEFQKSLNEAIRELRPDIIIAEWTPYTVFVSDIDSIKKIMVAHNIESTIWQRYYENEKNFLKKQYIKEQWRKLLAFEKTSFEKADGVTAVSKIEAEEISSISGNKQVAVIENGVDLAYFVPQGKTGEKLNLVFTGSMDWRPNQDATTFFVESIFPLLRKHFPHITATFVGRNPTEEITVFGEIDGITITGTVDDVRPYIAEGSIYIVPLRIGGGSRLKILEALAMKKPIVSTTVGAEGLQTEDRKHLLLAETPQDFLDAIIELTKNQTLADSLGENGRKLVEEKYGWDAISEKFYSFLCEVRETK